MDQPQGAQAGDRNAGGWGAWVRHHQHWRPAPHAEKEAGHFQCVFAAAYLTLATWTLPQVGEYPDSAFYLRLSFLGNTERLWTVPVVFTLAGSATGQAIAQSAIGAACWIALAVEVGRAVRHLVIAHTAAGLVLLGALTAPVTQWNRVVLSESLVLPRLIPRAFMLAP
ncbi:MAG: hypothetical protein M3Y91_10460 [Actinomycetota bacterium]|nr:hypothetical protein [Actinomycetota bacterium]